MILFVAGALVRSENYSLDLSGFFPHLVISSVLLGNLAVAIRAAVTSILTAVHAPCSGLLFTVVPEHTVCVLSSRRDNRG